MGKWKRQGQRQELWEDLHVHNTKALDGVEALLDGQPVAGGEGGPLGAAHSDLDKAYFRSRPGGARLTDFQVSLAEKIAFPIACARYQSPDSREVERLWQLIERAEAAGLSTRSTFLRDEIRSRAKAMDRTGLDYMGPVRWRILVRNARARWASDPLGFPGMGW